MQSMHLSPTDSGVGPFVLVHMSVNSRVLSPMPFCWGYQGSHDQGIGLDNLIKCLDVAG